MKRAIDIILGTLCALFALPIIVVLAIGVAVSLKTSPFFVQRRVGRRGRLFPMLKLRTLPKSAPRAANKYDLSNVAVPRFTQFLRTTHLDELPQLFLVPLGYLSLVGPRPEMPSLHNQADPVFAAERVQVRPGCTGVWQISTAANGLIWEAPEYDRYYLRHQSVGFDLWIVWQTLLGFVGLVAPVRLASVTETSDAAYQPEVALQSLSA
jgi:lipopolysaccharide/colanic/teichoic acid biosynthesis glycosyltransferase